MREFRINTYTGLKLERKILERQYHDFPEWMPSPTKTKHNTALEMLAEGVVEQLARRCSVEYIAKWWGCPVNFVRAVKITHATHINKRRKELVIYRAAMKRVLANRDSVNAPTTKENAIIALFKAVNAVEE